MFIPFTTLILLGLGLAPAMAELSWDYTDQRKQQAKEARKHQKTIQEIEAREKTRQPSPAEQAAYAKLGKALATHPEMAAVNLTESTAIADYQKATQAGNELAISLASQKLAKAKAERFQKAASIPELNALIMNWQQAALTTGSPEENAEAEKNTKSIGKKLGELLQQIDP